MSDADSFGRSRSLMVYEKSLPSEKTDLTTAVELTITARMRWGVVCRKGAGLTGPSKSGKWATTSRVTDISSPSDLLGALNSAEHHLQDKLNWKLVLEQVARFDWVMAVAMAQ